MINSLTDPSVIAQNNHMGLFAAAAMNVRNGKRARRLEENQQDFQRGTDLGISPPSKIQRDTRAMEAAEIASKTSIVLHLASTVEGFTPQERYTRWQNRMSGEVFLADATRCHIYNMFHMASTLVYHYYITDPVARFHLRKIGGKLMPMKGAIIHWVRDPSPDRLIHEFAKGPMQMMDYLRMEAEVSYFLVRKFSCFISANIGSLEESWEAILSLTKRSALTILNSPEFRANASGPALRNAQAFVEKINRGLSGPTRR